MDDTGMTGADAGTPNAQAERAIGKCAGTVDREPAVVGRSSARRVGTCNVSPRRRDYPRRGRIGRVDRGVVTDPPVPGPPDRRTTDPAQVLVGILVLVLIVVVVLGLATLVVWWWRNVIG